MLGPETPGGELTSTGAVRRRARWGAPSGHPTVSSLTWNIRHTPAFDPPFPRLGRGDFLFSRFQQRLTTHALRANHPRPTRPQLPEENDTVMRRFGKAFTLVEGE